MRGSTWLSNGMSVPPLPDLDTLSLDELKKLVVQLLVRVSALEEENQQLRAENARLKALPKKPKLAPGGMDKATEPNKRARTKQARRQRRKRQSGRRTPPVTTERTLVIEAPAGSRRRGFEPFTVQDLILAPQVIRFRRERWLTPDGQEIVSTAAARGERPLWPRDRALCPDAARPGAGDGGAPARPAERLGRAHLEGSDRHPPDGQQGCFPYREGRPPGSRAGDCGLGDG